jgi:hypothetical protein
MTDPKPFGKPYNLIYVERGKATEDSVRLRHRLGAYVAQSHQDSRIYIAQTLNRELAARTNFMQLDEYFQDCDVPDLLSAITHVRTALGKLGHEWVVFAQRAFKEENIAYSIDDKGGAHPAFDEEFDTSRQATISVLQSSRYAAALKDFSDAIADLKQPRDTRDAVRKTFEAVENVAKLMSSKISRLGMSEVQKVLKPVATERLEGTERDATNKMMTSFAEWVNACQPYRHAPGVEEPEPPSLELAIWIVSAGAAHLRWLVEVDQATSVRSEPNEIT